MDMTNLESLETCIQSLEPQIGRIEEHMVDLIRCVVEKGDVPNELKDVVLTQINVRNRTADTLVIRIDYCGGVPRGSSIGELGVCLNPGEAEDLKAHDGDVYGSNYFDPDEWGEDVDVPGHESTPVVSFNQAMPFEGPSYMATLLVKVPNECGSGFRKINISEVLDELPEDEYVNAISYVTALLLRDAILDRNAGRDTSARRRTCEGLMQLLTRRGEVDIKEFVAPMSIRDAA